MQLANRLQCAGWGLLAGLMFLPTLAGGQAIESGRYFSGTLSTNNPIDPYYFDAVTNETVIVRVATEDAVYTQVPDINIYSPITQLVASVSNKYTVQDVRLAVTNSGWFTVHCCLPVSLQAISNEFAYSVSFLRMPNAPLSYADLDVGNIENGESLTGTINVGADLDAAFFSVSNQCRVILRMGQINVNLVPNVYLYDPAGNLVTNELPPEYRSEITAYLTETGRYTVVYNDYFNANGDYAVSMARMPGAVASSDPDFGTIINGETLTGTIHNPGDLDVATFTAIIGDTNVLAMTKISSDMNPRMELYDPSGSNLLYAPVDPFQNSVTITNNCTNAGTFYVICKDAEDRYGVNYTLSMTILGGPSATLVPDIPAGITASDGAYTNSIMITWNSVTNASGYDLWRSDGTNTLVYTWLVTNTTYLYYQDSSVTQNMAYYYKVKARNTYGASAFSTNDRGYCGAVPAAPTGLTASDGTFSNYVFVTWSSVTNATGYDLWRTSSTNSTTYTELFTNSAAVSYQDSNVTYNLSYNYKVKSRNICGVSAFSTNDPGYCGVSFAATNRRALLAGLDTYGYGPSDLTTCTNDMMGIQNTMLLGDPSNRWDATNITTLLDQQATKSAIRDGLHSLAAQSGSGDLVVYAHSSHGGYGPGLADTYVCAYDAAYTDTELASDLTFFRLDTRIIIIIDACYSGGMYLQANMPLEWPFAERVMEEYQRIQQAKYKSRNLDIPKGLGTNIAFMTACDYDETCQTYSYYSLYMNFLIRGCSNSAVDDNADNEYQFSELHSYASTHALEINPYQHAQTYNLTLLQNVVARAVSMNAGGSFDLHNDYDGDGVSDLAIYNEASGSWYIGSVARQVIIGTNIIMGGPGYHPFTGDYDGDSKADLTVYSETAGLWRIGSLARWVQLAWDVAWGGPGQRPVVGDYNGDSYDDGALYESANGYWYVVTTFGRVLVYGDSFTGAGFTAVPGDYNGDGIADYALYHNAQGYWYIMSSAGSSITWGTSWGATGYVPVSGDYDGDGRSDLAVYNEASGLWYIRSIARGRTILGGVAWGGTGFTPVPGDFNGDRKAELAVYQNSTGNWRIRTVDGSQQGLYNFGGPDYIPARPAW